MNALQRIAGDMRTTLTATNARYVHYRLQRGLEVVLERRDRGFRLALGRVGVPPSDTEIELCQQAFAAPPDVEPQRLTKTRSGKTGAMTYHVAELYWSEVN